MNKSNTGKILVAVLAIVMVLAAFTAVASTSDAVAGTTYDLQDNDKVVTVYKADGTAYDEKITLGQTIQIINGSTVGSYTNVSRLVFDAGIYNVTNSFTCVHGDYTGSAFVVKKANISIEGAGEGQTLIYSDYANKGAMTVTDDDNGEEQTSDYKYLNQQNTITIEADGVSISNLTVETMVYYNNGSYAVSKGILVGNNDSNVKEVAISDVTVADNSNRGSQQGTVADKVAQVPGIGIYTNSLVADINNVTVQSGAIGNLSSGTVTGTISDVVMNVESTEGDLTADIVALLTGDNTINVNVAPTDANEILNAAKDGTTFNVNAPLDLSNNATTLAPGVVINAYASITGNNIINNAQINVMGESVQVQTTGGSGTINTSGVSSEADLGGELRTDTTFTDKQIVTVNQNLVLVEGTTLVINGTLIVPEGMSVTVEGGAKLVINGQAASMENNGTIIIESTGNSDTVSNISGLAGGLIIANGATAENNGTVEAAYYPVTPSDTFTDIVSVGVHSTFENNGSVTVGAESAIDIAGTFVNAEGSTFEMNGQITAAGTIENSGSITIDGTAIGAVTISNAVAGATVQVITYSGPNYLAINDQSFDDSKTIDNTDDVSGIVLDAKAADNNTIGGVIVTSTTYDDTVGGERVTYKALDVSGTVAVSNSAAGVTGSGNITLYGDKVQVTDTLNAGTGVKVLFGNTTRGPVDLTVSGTVNFTAPSSGDSKMIIEGVNGSEITVTGEIVSQIDLANICVQDTQTPATITINAASYYVTANAVRTYHYTTLATAVSSGNTPIITTGNITVDSDLTIPSGVTVNQNGGITVTEDATLTVADGARINQSGTTITVEGTLYVEVARTGFRNGSAISDVYSTDGTDARYTNLSKAMEAAQSGDTIYLYQENVRIDYNFIIKDGVTLDTNEKNLEVYGVTLTINGTLYINNGDFTVTDYSGTTGYQYDGNIVLNGYMKSNDTMTYNANADEYPAGAYYSMKEQNSTYSYITTVDNAAGIINDTVGDTFTINGEVSFGNIEVAGVTNYPATIAIASNADITAGTITIDLANVNFAANSKFTGSVTDGNGTFAFTAGSGTDKPENFAAESVIAAGVDDDGSNTFMISGDYDGLTTVNGTAKIGSFQAAEMVIDGTASVDGTAGATTLTVNGDVRVLENGIFQIGTAYVYGTLDATEATATTSPGTATITTLYAGLEKNSDNQTLATATAGTVSGNVTAGTSYVSADSVVTEKITAATNVEATQFFVEDALWITTYAASSATVDVRLSAENAQFNGWMRDGDDEVRYGASTNPTFEKIPATEDALYANIIYDVYVVVIYTDGGIASVAIDGNILFQSGNAFTNVVDSGNGNGIIGKYLSAGQHTVSYTLKNGYQGEAVLSSEDVTVNGLSFSIEGDIDQIYSMNLSGTEPADQTVVIEGGSNGGSDSLGLTDYLLIILVILIVIMAIMVAFRLMRS